MNTADYNLVIINRERNQEMNEHISLVQVTEMLAPLGLGNNAKTAICRWRELLSVSSQVEVKEAMKSSKDDPSPIPGYLVNRGMDIKTAKVRFSEFRTLGKAFLDSNYVPDEDTGWHDAVQEAREMQKAKSQIRAESANRQALQEAMADELVNINHDVDNIEVSDLRYKAERSM
ncbi:MAG: hypothetical protein ACREQ5_33660, partial [Candidatus Dormibacteria bacterium]